MSRFTLKQKLLGIILFITAVLVIISVLVVWPSIKRISELKQGIEEIESGLEQRYLNSQKLRKTMHELDEIKAQIAKFSQVTVEANSELRVITELEQLAARHNIKQTLNVSLNETEGKNKASGYYQLSFLNNGMFEDHVKYLAELESSVYYTIIKNVHWEKRQGSTGESTPVILTFDATIYVD